MWVQKCDLCGEEKNTEKFRYKVKVKKEAFCWEDCWWKKLDICEDCQKEIVSLIKLSQWKEAIRLRAEKEKNNE